MKTGILHGGVMSRVGGCSAMLALSWLVASSAAGAMAGNIFDDDWTPPKPAVHPPVTPPQLAPPVSNPTTPAPPAPNPASAPPTAPPPAAEQRPAAPARHAIPGKLEQARSRGLLREAFAVQLKDRTPAGRKKLVQALMSEVPKAADNVSDEFVLLGGAIEASKEAAQLRTCFQAADTMASQYDVDATSIKIDAALRTNLRGDSPATASENIHAALELIDPLLSAEDFATAAKILAAARPAAAGDPALLASLQKRAAFVENLRTAHDRLAQHLEKLKASPGDPAANLAVGSYYCFSRGEWEKGLQMLAKGSDANLKKLASLELSHPTATDAVARVADGWWDYAAKQSDMVRGVIYQHAASYYNIAIRGETGLRRTIMERRIADASIDRQPSRPTTTTPRIGPDVFVNSIGMKFVRIKAGEFMMGSPPNENGRKNDETLHKVIITRSFMMAMTPVTQAEYKAIMGKNPGHFPGDRHPVDHVSWDEAATFCEKLSTRDRLHYRLPTEAEWEYACRAGTQSAYSFGDGNLDDFAWNGANSDKQTHDVGTKKPNPWGLYDMHGNTCQWCADGYGPYNGDAVDPKGADDAPTRVLRGGNFANSREHLRAADRYAMKPGSRYDGHGFRVVLDIPGEQAAIVSPQPVRRDPSANSLGMKFVRITPGEFMMGSPETETGRKADETLHQVKITKPFMIATTPVTQAQWKAVMGSNPSHFKGDQLPVDTVSWNDAVAFCDKLSARERNHYRLPTEAEWEYACRAGTQTAFGGTGNLDEMGWYADNSDKQTHPVALKKPNAWGLFDMHGNVWQWCSDGYGAYAGDAVDPTGSSDTTLRVLKGGGWRTSAPLCRCAYRDKHAPDLRANDFGIRLVLEVR